MITTKTNIEQKLDKEISILFKHSLVFGKDNPIKNRLTYAQFISNKMLIIAAIKNGIPFSLFKVIKLYTPFSENDWADFLNISTKSLQRYRQSARNFKPIQSEKIIEIAEVTNIGLDVFGDLIKFKLWLDTPNFPLGNLKPFELLKHSYGKELVIGELTRINYGILV